MGQLYEGDKHSEDKWVICMKEINTVEINGSFV